MGFAVNAALQVSQFYENVFPVSVFYLFIFWLNFNIFLHLFNLNNKIDIYVCF